MSREDYVEWHELGDRGKFLAIILISAVIDLFAIVAWVAIGRIGQSIVHSVLPEGTTYVIPIGVLDWLVWLIPGALVLAYVVKDAVRILKRIVRSG